MNYEMRIRVTPQQLEAVAGEADAKLKALKTKLETIESAISSTSIYWTGNAGSRHRELYEQLRSKTDDVMNRWLQHPADLREIAGTYAQTEKEAETIADSLSGNVIF